MNAKIFLGLVILTFSLGACQEKGEQTGSAGPGWMTHVDVRRR